MTGYAGTASGTVGSSGERIESELRWQSYSIYSTYVLGNLVHIRLLRNTFYSSHIGQVRMASSMSTGTLRVNSLTHHIRRGMLRSLLSGKQRKRRLGGTTAYCSSRTQRDGVKCTPRPIRHLLDLCTAVAVYVWLRCEYDNSS